MHLYRNRTIAQYIYHIRTQEQDLDETEESDRHHINDWMLICQHNAEFGRVVGERTDPSRLSYLETKVFMSYSQKNNVTLNHMVKGQSCACTKFSLKVKLLQSSPQWRSSRKLLELGGKPDNPASSASFHDT